MKKVGIIVLTLAGVFMITGCGCEKKKEVEENNPPVIEQNGTILPDKTVDGLKYTNASVVYEKGVSTVVLNVTNTGSTDKNVEFFTLKFYDGNHNLITSIDGYIGATLKPKESKSVTTQASTDLRNAKEVEYEIK